MEVNSDPASNEQREITAPVYGTSRTQFQTHNTEEASEANSICATDGSAIEKNQSEGPEPNKPAGDDPETGSGTLSSGDKRQGGTQKREKSPGRKASVESQLDKSSYSSALASNQNTSSLDGEISPKDSLSELRPKVKTVNSILSYHSLHQDSQTEQRADGIVAEGYAETDSEVTKISAGSWTSEECDESAIEKSIIVEVDLSNNLVTDLNTSSSAESQYDGAEECVSERRIQEGDQSDEKVGGSTVVPEVTEAKAQSSERADLHQSSAQNLVESISQEQPPLREVVSCEDSVSSMSGTREENSSRARSICDQLDEIIREFDDLEPLTDVQEAEHIYETPPFSRALRQAAGADSFETNAISNITLNESNFQPSNNQFSHHTHHQEDNKNLEPVPIAHKTQTTPVPRVYSQVHFYSSGKQVSPSDPNVGIPNDTIQIFLNPDNSVQFFCNSEERKFAAHHPSTEIQKQPEQNVGCKDAKPLISSLGNLYELEEIASLGSDRPIDGQDTGMNDNSLDIQNRHASSSNVQPNPEDGRDIPPTKNPKHIEATTPAPEPDTVEENLQKTNPLNNSQECLNKEIIDFNSDQPLGKEGVEGQPNLLGCEETAFSFSNPELTVDQKRDTQPTTLSSTENIETVAPVSEPDTEEKAPQKSLSKSSMKSENEENDQCVIVQVSNSKIRDGGYIREEESAPQSLDPVSAIESDESETVSRGGERVMTECVPALNDLSQIDPSDQIIDSGVDDRTNCISNMEDEQETTDPKSSLSVLEASSKEQSNVCIVNKGSVFGYDELPAPEVNDSPSENETAEERDTLKESPKNEDSSEVSPNVVDLNEDDLTKIWDFVELNLQQAKQLYGIIQQPEGGGVELVGQRSSKTSQVKLKASFNNCDSNAIGRVSMLAEDLARADERKCSNNESNSCSKVVTFSETTMLRKSSSAGSQLISQSEVMPQECGAEVEDSMLTQMKESSPFGSLCEPMSPETTEAPCQMSFANPSSDHSQQEQFSYTVPDRVFVVAQGPTSQPRESILQDEVTVKDRLDQEEHGPSEQPTARFDGGSGVNSPKEAYFGRTSFVFDMEIPKGLVEDTRKVIESISGMAMKPRQKLSKDSVEMLRETVNIKNSRERYLQVIKTNEGVLVNGDQQKFGKSMLPRSQTPSISETKPIFNSNYDEKKPREESNSDVVSSLSCNYGNFEVTEKRKMSQIMRSNTTHRLIGGSNCVDVEMASFGPLSADMSALNAAASEQGEHFISFLATPTPEKTPSGSTSHMDQRAKNLDRLRKWDQDNSQGKQAPSPAFSHDDSTQNCQDNSNKQTRLRSVGHYMDEKGPKNFGAETISLVGSSTPSTSDQSEVGKCSRVGNHVLNSGTKNQPSTVVQSTMKCNSKRSFISVSTKRSWKSENGDEYRNTLSKNDLLNNDFPATNEILRAIVINKSISAQRSNASSHCQAPGDDLKPRSADRFPTKDQSAPLYAMRTDSFTQTAKLGETQARNVNESSKNKNRAVLAERMCKEDRNGSKADVRSVKSNGSRIYSEFATARGKRSDCETLGFDPSAQVPSGATHGATLTRVSSGNGQTEREATRTDSVTKEKSEYLILCQYYSLVQSSEPAERAREGDATPAAANGGAGAGNAAPEHLEAQVHVRLSPAMTQMLSQPNLAASSLKSGVEMVTITSDASLPRWSRLNLVATCTEFCRICHDTAGSDDFISPCQCRGSLSRVHKFCLEKWLAESDTSACELCGHQFQILRVPRYSVMNSIFRWFNSQENVRDVRELFFDMVALCAFTPMIIGGSYFGLLVAETVYQRMVSSTVSRAASFTLVSMMTTMDLAFLSWFALRTQHHTMQWYGWWRRNCDVKIILPEQNQARAKNLRYDNQSP